MIAIFTKKAEKDFFSLNKSIQIKVQTKIEQYIENPSSVNFKLLKGYQNIGRIRAGDYRIICKFVNKEIEILEIIRIQHRKDVYKNL